jgi:opacity protein-like surface antigen
MTIPFLYPRPAVQTITWLIPSLLLMLTTTANASIDMPMPQNKTNATPTTQKRVTYDVASKPKPMQRTVDEQCPDATNAPQPDLLHFSFAPYLWGTAVDGTMVVGGIRRDIDVPFSQIATHLNGGGAVHLEANYNRWTPMLDVMYLKVSKKEDMIRVPFEVTSEDTLADVGVFYQVGPRAVYLTQATVFEVLVGGRYIRTKNSLNFINGPSLSNTVNVFAPIVGARLKYDMSYRIRFWLRGDYGGFNVNDMKTTWSADLGVAFNPSEHTSLGLGYRALKIDIDKTKGGLDALFYGPILGFDLHY